MMELPNTWTATTFSQIAEFRNGLNFNKSSNGEAVKIVSIPHFWNREILDKYQNINTAQVNGKLSDLDLIENNDLLFVRSNGNKELIGRCLLFKNVTERISFSGFTIRARLNQNKICPDFAAILSRSELTRAQFMKLGGGTNISNLSQAILSSVKIALPPLAEQKRIAEILSTWDRAIEVVEGLIKNSQAQKKALMQQLLTGKKRLPGFEGEWETAKLGDLGVISSAGVDKKINSNEQKVRLLNFLDVFRKELIFNNDLAHEVTAPAAKIKNCNALKGDIFFTPSSETRVEIAVSAVAAENLGGVVYSYHVVRFRLKECWDVDFCSFIFQTDDFRRQAYRLGDGSGQRYVISQPNFRKMTVSFPSNEEQKAIGKVLRNASDGVSELQLQLFSLQREKSALMQQLLTGKRRVTIDKEVAHA